MKKEELKLSYYNSTLSAMIFYPDIERTKYPIVIKAHGLVSNDFSKEEVLATMFTDRGIAYFVFHFSGFFDSPGETSVQTSLSNLDYIVTYLANHPKVDPFNIGLYGVSLGAAIAICHAARDSRISSLALQSPLYDFSFVVNYPEFNALWDGLASTGLVRLPAEGVKEKLITDIRGNNPLICIGRISPRPLLIIAGSKDSFIPIEGIKQLYINAKKPKNFQLIDNADHNLTDTSARYRTFNLVCNFFSQHLAEI